ncbi:WhiB family transcriptional regulator [Nonomuraea sp. NPDC050790]|uniref:WhiB family transcriptional regulator n=1 Tax=Nonomuraea sp. NPDC050790 TaxID=3364371 RepID=UPI00378E20CD
MTARARTSPAFDWTWQQQAACRGTELMLFFRTEGERAGARDARERRAQQVCGRCPVREPCLAYALSRPEKYGTWGGLNEDERASERRRRSRQSAGGVELPPSKRLCCACNEVKAVTDFYGHKAACKACVRARQRQLRRRKKAQAS